MPTPRRQQLLLLASSASFFHFWHLLDLEGTFRTWRLLILLLLLILGRSPSKLLVKRETNEKRTTNSTGEMDEFIHSYEMESLTLGITARKDVIDQVTAFFPKSESHIAGMLRTTQALAARHEAKKCDDDEERKEEDANDSSNASVAKMRKSLRDWTLVLAGNSRECFRNRLRNIHVVALAAAVVKSNLTGIRVLDLRFNHLGEVHDAAVGDGDDESHEHVHDERKHLLDAAPSLGRMLQSAALYESTIEELVLSGNRLGGESCRLLCAALRANTTLRKLDLSGNPLRIDGGRALAQLLASRESGLQELNIGSTEMEAENLIALSTVLRSNTSLLALNLDNPVLKSTEVRHCRKLFGTLSATTLQYGIEMYWYWYWYTVDTGGGDPASRQDAASERHTALPQLVQAQAD